MAFPGMRSSPSAAMASFSIPAAESFLRTFSPPVLGLNGEIVNTPYIFAGVLRPPPRTPLAASSLSSLKTERDVYVSQPVNGSSPTILLVNAEPNRVMSSPRGVPAVHLPYNNATHAAALYWRLIQGLQHALATSTSSSPVDPVTIYREVLRDYEYRTMVLGQNRNLHADNNCSVTPEGDGMCFRSVAGENAEAFFQRQLGPDVHVLIVSAADVRPWAHSYPAQMVDMAMDVAAPLVAEPVAVTLRMPEVSMAVDAAMIAPQASPAPIAVPQHHVHAHPAAVAHQQPWMMDSAMSFGGSKKRKLVEATTESCRKVARLIAKPHFRTRPASWTTA